jgi:hypothetical protein
VAITDLELRMTIKTLAAKGQRESKESGVPPS